VGEKERLYLLNSHAQKFYSYVLLSHKLGRKALSYLTEKRGIKIDTIKKFSLGFSPNMDGPLTNFLIGKKKFTKAELVKAGIVYARGNVLVDRFKGRVIFPLYDHRGNVIAFAGRILPELEDRDLAKYINSPETPVYKKSRVLYGLNITKADVKAKKEAVVVEGELDMISSYQAGIKNVVAIKGSALTSEQVSLLGRFCERLVLAYDSDAAGNTACRRGIAIAQEAGLDINVAEIEGYKDPDEMARKNPHGLKKIFENPIGAWDFLIRSTFSKYEIKTGSGKAKISREIVPVLASIPDKIVQAHYVEKVAEKLSIPASAVYGQIEKTKSFRDVEIKEEQSLKVPDEKTRQILLQERLLTLAFQTDPDKFIDEDLKSLIVENVFKRILHEYDKFVKNNKKFDASLFSSQLPRELFDQFSVLMLQEVVGGAFSEEKLVEEFELVKKELAILKVKEELVNLEKKMKECENKKDAEAVHQTQELFSQKTRELAKLEENRGKGIIL
jgi:DNA primase